MPSIKLKISQKLPLLITSLAALAGISTGVITMNEASTEALVAAEQKLTALQASREQSLESYLHSISEDLSVLASSELVRQVLMDYQAGWKDLAINQSQRLQSIYINPNSLNIGNDAGWNDQKIGEKHKYDGPRNGSLYDKFHRQHHPWFREFLEKRGYYDIFLFDKEGNIIYTVYKELDFATNMNTGPWKDTDIAKAFRAVKDKPTSEFQAFFDFSPYKPSNNVPASFIAQAILAEDGTFAGAIAFQMPITRINEVMQVAAGMGESGETYIVGSDHLMRSDSRFSKESTILKTEIKTPTADRAINNEQGVEIEKDYRGIDVVSAYGPVEFLGTRWAILAEIDLSEVMAPINKMKLFVLGSTLVTLLGVLLVGLYASRKISKPITDMTSAMNELARNNFEVQIPGRERSDEIGEMAASVQVFKENGLEAKRLRDEQVINEQRANDEKRRIMREMADQFDAQVGGTIQRLAEAAEKLQDASKRMEGTASETQQASASVASASEETSANAATVASATEEMTASAMEISKQITEVASKATLASNSANSTSVQVDQLNNLVANIGEVVVAIKDIAEQTNLLALNATIEAARAGEAGKGFAVVADEVKKLANETAKKTEEIEGRISQIQNATQASVSAMQEIIRNIADIDASSTGTASAVEEQNSVISEITRNITEVSDASRQVANVIVNVQAAASETGAASQMLRISADEIAGLSDSLERSVTQFLDKIRTDNAISGQPVVAYRQAAE